VGINTDNGVQVQPIVSTIQNGYLQIPIEPVRDRWPQNLQVYSRWKPRMHGEQQGSSDASSSDRQQPHVQGEQ
jgi:hypothetical protein